MTQKKQTATKTTNLYKWTKRNKTKAWFRHLWCHLATKQLPQHAQTL